MEEILAITFLAPHFADEKIDRLQVENGRTKTSHMFFINLDFQFEHLPLPSSHLGTYLKISICFHQVAVGNMHWGIKTSASLRTRQQIQLNERNSLVGLATNKAHLEA